MGATLPDAMTRHADFRIASWNIHKGVGADRRRDLTRTSEVIVEIGADIIALQEADLRFGNRAGLLDLEALEDEAGLVPVPVGLPGPSHGWHGNLILVRKAVVTMVEAAHRLTLPGLEPRGALMVELMVAGHPLRVIAAHFGLLPASRRAQARTLLDRIADLPPHPTLLMGDLNEWRHGPGSPLAHLERHFPPVPPVRSFPARWPMLSLDRIMVGPVGKVQDIAVHDTTLSRRASDHLPLTARLSLPKVAK
jgi:endonuclease/exonuclease/phosphatase family metal-dependent hydrolase